MNYKLVLLPLFALLLPLVPAEAQWIRLTASAIFEPETRAPHPKRIRLEVPISKRIPPSLDGPTPPGPTVSYDYDSLHRQYWLPDFQGRFEVIFEHWRGDTLLFVDMDPRSRLPLRPCFWVEFPPGYELRTGDLIVARVKFRKFPRLRADEFVSNYLLVEAPGRSLCH